jgi:hypothetical protein
MRGLLTAAVVVAALVLPGVAFATPAHDRAWVALRRPGSGRGKAKKGERG